MSIEQGINAQAWADDFWQDCQAVFGDPIGQRVLRRLCELAHPLSSPLQGSTEETHVVIGRNEIVAALWRRSQAAIQPSDAPPNPPYGQNKN